IFPLLIFGLFFILYMAFPDSIEYEIKTMHIGSLELSVAIADTARLQVRGLSDQDALCEDCGMLFVYDDSKIRRFWMKHMRFNLDVLWIDDGHVAGMQENIPFEPKNGQITRFQSEIVVNMALEVNAGWIAKNGVKIGDRVVVDSN
ncbi:MAG: hypothetical protein COY02_02720, partial [Parcubacteria group bacterium CG_4_10_14_0_2_um_filter_41_6]